ncbi:MAG: DUF4339 domain-containing protein [Thermoguttaceae bacterium]|nr:DUF4339 domain-containing protein [Thermoguttaceae bacterium]
MNYYVKIDGRAFGPITDCEMRQKIKTGVVTEDTLVSTDRATWSPARLVPGLFRNSGISPVDAREWWLSVSGKAWTGPFTARELDASFASGRATYDAWIYRSGEKVRRVRNDASFLELLVQARAPGDRGATLISEGKPSPKEWLAYDARGRALGPFTAERLLEEFELGRLAEDCFVQRGQAPRKRFEDAREELTRIARPLSALDPIDVPEPPEPVEGTEAALRENFYKANDRLNAFCLLSAIPTTIASGFYFIFYVVAIAALINGENLLDFAEFGRAHRIGSIAFWVFALFTTAGTIFGILFVSEFWRSIPPRLARTTPGSAWLLLAPFWQYYWILPIFSGGAHDVDVALSVFGKNLPSDAPPIPVVGVGLAGTLCVVSWMVAFLGIPFPLILFGNPVLMLRMKSAASRLNELRAEASREA